LKKLGWETPDGYATIPWGKKFVIIYKGEQLADVPGIRQANAYIKTHRESQGINKFLK
jgi:hypothetical protein